MIKQGCVALISLSAVVGCGGEGGNSENSAHGTIPNIASPKVSDLLQQYQGNKEPYAVNQDTAGAVLFYIYNALFNHNNQLSASSAASSLDNSIEQQTRDLSKRYTPQRLSISPQLKDSVTTNCMTGSITETVDINDQTGTGYIKVHFNECSDGVTLQTGTIHTIVRKVDGDEYGFNITDFSIHYDQYRITEAHSQASNYITMHGSIESRGASSCDFQTTSRLGIFTNNPNDSVLLNDVVQHSVCQDDNAPYSYKEYSLSGQVYLGQHGHFSLDTVQPMVSSGTALLAQGGLSVTSDSGIITLSPSNDPDVDTIAVVINEANATDASFEDDIDRGFWTSPQELDLSDHDNDGMWASWEISNLLDPDLNDANVDSDGDGYSNYIEFIFGSSPQNRYGDGVPAIDVVLTHTYNSYLRDYHQTVYQGQSATIPLELFGHVPSVVHDDVTNTTMTIQLDSAYDWSYTGQRCTLLNAMLTCHNIDLSKLKKTDALSLGSLEVNTANSYFDISLEPRFTATFENIQGNKFQAVNVIGISTEPLISSTDSAFNIDSSSHTYEFEISETNTPSQRNNDSDYIYKTVTGLLPINSGVTFTSVKENKEKNNYLPEADCDFSSYQFECELPASTNYLKLTLSHDQQQSIVPLEINSQIEFGDYHTTTRLETPRLVFGVNSKELEEAINRSNDHTFSAPNNIYVGPMSINRNVEIIGQGGFSLWLPGTKGQWDYARDLVSHSNVVFKNVEVHSINKSCIELKSGGFVNSKIHAKDITDCLFEVGTDFIFEGNRMYIDGIDQTSFYTSIFKFMPDQYINAQINADIKNSIISVNHDLSQYQVSLFDTPTNNDENIIFTNNTIDGICYSQTNYPRYVNNAFLGLEDTPCLWPSQSQGDFHHNLFSNFANLGNLMSNSGNFEASSDEFDRQQDYKPITDSLAIDAGLQVSLDYDIDGLTRNVGASVDIGAHEYQH